MTMSPSGFKLGSDRSSTEQAPIESVVRSRMRLLEGDWLDQFVLHERFEFRNRFHILIKYRTVDHVAGDGDSKLGPAPEGFLDRENN